MKTRWIVLVALVLLAVALTAGLAWGAAARGPQRGAWMDGMHGSPAMERAHDAMLDAMPADLAAQCEAMHAAMGGSGMMGPGGSGMMGPGGSGMMGPGGSGMMGGRGVMPGPWR